MAPFAKKSVRRAILYGLPFVSLLIALMLRRDASPFATGDVWWEIGAPVLSIVLLIPTVLVALRHADAAADRLGEPLGTLLLTLAVTTIEVR